MRLRLKRFMPVHGLVLLVVLLVINYLTYQGTRLFTTAWPHHMLGCKVDSRIKLFPPFIVIYWAAYVQWIIGYILIARDDRKICFRYLLGECIAKLLCMIIFLSFPTTIIRPEVNGSGIFCRLMRVLYTIDAPDNLFPSIHCLESYIICRSGFCLTRIKHKKVYAYVMSVMSILVFASTLYTKQHVLIDMLGAVIVAEFGLLMSKLIINKLGKKNING